MYGNPHQSNQGGQQGNSNSGYLFPNDKKNTANQPDHKGKITLGEDIVQRVLQGEREFFLGGWNKFKNNQQSVSLKISGKMEKVDPRTGGIQGPYTPPVQGYAPAVPQQVPQYPPQQAGYVHHGQAPYNPQQAGYVAQGGHAIPVVPQAPYRGFPDPQGPNYPAPVGGAPRQSVPPAGNGYPNDEIPF